MENGLNDFSEGLFRQLSEHRLPRWEEIPDLDLYMDQVLNLIRRYLNAYPGFEKNGVTSSMVNNYVKAGLLPPPVRKRYATEHVARLFMICILKNTLPIATIKTIFDDISEREAGMSFFYNVFCERFEQTYGAAVNGHLSAGYESVTDMIMSASLRAQAEQAIAVKLCSADTVFQK